MTWAQRLKRVFSIDPNAARSRSVAAAVVRSGSSSKRRTAALRTRTSCPIKRGRLSIEYCLTCARKNRKHRLGHCWCHRPERHLGQGELLRAEDNNEQAEQCFRTALKVAAEQSALSLELRAASSLARLHLDTALAPDATERLSDTLERFTEGFDTADLLEANLILKKLS